MLKKYKKKLIAFGGAVLLIVFGAAFWKNIHAKPEYIFLMSGVRNFQDYPMFQQFEKEVHQLGGKAIVLDYSNNEEYSAIKQIELLSDTVNRNTACVIVNAASIKNLTGELKKYHNDGIKVISCMNKTETEYCDLHVGTVNPSTAGAFLMDEVKRECPSDGRFIVVSDSAQAEFLTTLLMNVRHTYEKKYCSDVLLSDIVFRNNDEDIFRSNLKNSIMSIDGIDVILCLSEQAAQMACATVKSLAMEKQITILGLGSPEGLKDYLADTSLKLKIFYNDYDLLGRGIAQIGHALVEEKIQGNVGEKVEIEGVEYQIQEEEPVFSQDILDNELYFYSEFQQEVSAGYDN